MAYGAVTLTGIEPRGVIEGGRVWLRGQGLPAPPGPGQSISVGGAPAQVVFAGSDRCAVVVPPAATPGRAAVRASWAPGATLFVDVGTRLATGLHQVDSPVVGPDGWIYATFSGSRGQATAVSAYRVTIDGAREAFVDGLVNATGLAVAPDGSLYVSSRHDGTVYRIDDTGHARAVVGELGVPTGLAFAPDGSLFVGDRTGTIHRVTEAGSRVETFATLPASVAAFHLAFGPDQHLYVNAPTLATHDPVHRFSASGRHDTLDVPFGRPQGLAFDPHGVLHVVEALAGVSAIYRLDPAGPRRAVVAGPGLIGVAFAPDGALLAATPDSLYRFPAAT
ncbi:MAG: gluconolaconase [Vicinamibacterales bacterium]